MELRRGIIVLNYLVGGAALYGLAVGGLYFLQEGLIFPRRAAALASYPLPPTARRVSIKIEPDVEIVGNLVPAREPSRGLLLAFGGNAWNADDLTVFVSHRIKDHDVLVFHYRGYGPSSGVPSEQALLEDAIRIHDWATESLRPGRILAAGFSLGTGVAAGLASQRRLAGLVLVTPFDSIAAVAQARYSWAPVSRLIRHPFRSAEALAGLDLPVAAIVAGADQVIPRERSDALIAVLRQPVLVETVPNATHNGIYDLERLDELLRLALVRIDEAHAGPRALTAPRASAVEG